MFEVHVDSRMTTQDGRVLTGRLAEYSELQGTLAERPGLVVIEADPWSGTSHLLSAVLDQLPAPSLLVDVRSCSGSADVAMAIADKAVALFASDAFSWWLGSEPPASTAGLRLSRSLSQHGLDLTSLRTGAGPGDRLLSHAIKMVGALAGDRQPLVIVDHLGLLLSALRAKQSRQILGELRSARQQVTSVHLALVDHPAGLAAQALNDPEHPLFGAGTSLRIRRAKPTQFEGDLAITRPVVKTRVELLRTAAELAAGVPYLTWKIVDRAEQLRQKDAAEAAVAAWRDLQNESRELLSHKWGLLRYLHPAAQSVVAAMCLGLKPHQAPASSKTVYDVLNRLLGSGLAFQPEPRAWAFADPLLASWVRDHAPPWALRRSGYARASFPRGEANRDGNQLLEDAGT